MMTMTMTIIMTTMMMMMMMNSENYVQQALFTHQTIRGSGCELLDFANSALDTLMFLVEEMFGIGAA